MFDESDHPRDEDGKFTDGSGQRKTYRQNACYADIMAESRREAERIFNDEPTSGAFTGDITVVPIQDLLGKEFTGVKGQAAVAKLLSEKQGHVKGAFHREDIGDIDLLWGNDSLGLQHIIKQRERQGIDAPDFLKDISEVIERGEFYQKSERGNFEFLHNGKMAVIAPEFHGKKLTFVLTAYKTRKKRRE